ncbi:hypothetical protein SteCoe_24162 [Stentor coeruleus]|uniref:Checkpoint protein n=1 Tax=Stentor coeruleus TaxID=5963 RepID=A0A1R2BIL7_9CILI|nr:hypothetical protein SteCoe_24162 [Stentor coeruleus]
MSFVYLKLSKIENFLNVVNSLKAIQSTKIQFLIKKQELVILAQSAVKTSSSEAHIPNLEFDIYRTPKDTYIILDFSTLKTVLKSITKSVINTNIVMEYPCKDKKFLILCENESCASQFYLDTYDYEPNTIITPSNKLLASIVFKDMKIIKQAMEIACHGRQENEVFLRLSKEVSELNFFREDIITDVKMRVTVPIAEKVIVSISQDCEKIYSAKVLKGIANFPKCKEIRLKMHEDGVLEIDISVIDEVFARHFINPYDNV